MLGEVVVGEIVVVVGEVVVVVGEVVVVVVVVVGVVVGTVIVGAAVDPVRLGATETTLDTVVDDDDDVGTSVGDVVEAFEEHAQSTTPIMTRANMGRIATGYAAAGRRGPAAHARSQGNCDARYGRRCTAVGARCSHVTI